MKHTRFKFLISSLYYCSDFMVFKTSCHTLQAATTTMESVQTSEQHDSTFCHACPPMGLSIIFLVESRIVGFKLTYAVELPSLVNQFRQCDQDSLRQEGGGRGGGEEGERRERGGRGRERREREGGKERQAEHHPQRQLEDKFPDNQPPH